MKYKIIYADPPWKYNDTLKNNPRYGGITYNQLSIEELCKLPIKELTEKDCILFMWVTAPFIEDCFKVIKEWGFEYKTIGFVWVKTDSIGKVRTGIGNYTNSNSEICLIAKKGKIDRIKTDVKQICISKIREHSRKPDEIRNRIVQLYGDIPRIELFARERFEGWDAWGDEIPNETQQTIK